MSRTRQGKIARLPHTLRQEVNLRLLDGQPSREILPWLNAQPAALEVWDARFEGAPATPQNLSEWRLGGYKDWLRRRERVESTKTLREFSLKLVNAGGGKLAAGSAAIAAGEILGRIESAAEEELGDLINALKPLLKDEVAREKLALAQKQHALRREEVGLARDKFELQTVEKFLRWAKSDRAQAILDSGKPEDAKITDLRALMFGKVDPNG